MTKDQKLLEEAYMSIRESAPDSFEEKQQTYKRAVQSLKSSNLKVVSLELKYKVWENEELLILNDRGRDVILIDLGTIKMPFYNSTGEAGKERVVAEKWYPIFGIDPTSGWFNKPSQTQINNYYGSDILKSTSQKLDDLLGGKDCGWNVVDDKKSTIYNIINQDLSPTTIKDTKGFYANIASVLPKVNGAFKITLTGSSGNISARIPLEVNQTIAKQLVGEESKFFSSPQFSLIKSKNHSNVLWGIKQSPEAKNQTFVNGKEILNGGQTLKYGDVITLGKSGKGKIVVDV